jgi:hypothetical protein
MSDRKPIFIVLLGWSVTHEDCDLQIKALKDSNIRDDYHVVVGMGSAESTEFKLFSTEGVKPNEYGEIKEMINKLTDTKDGSN